MKPKHLKWVVFAVAIICVGIWWFMQPAASTPEKVAQAAVPAPTNQPKPVVLPIIAPPVFAPTPKTAAEPVAAAQSATTNSDFDPQADLKTVLPDLARLHRDGDLVTLAENYYVPGDIDPQELQDFKDEQAKDAAVEATSPATQQAMQKIHEATAQAWEAVESQTPTYNEAGNEATYMYTAPSGTDMLTGTFTNDSTLPLFSHPITFIKINGKWYIKKSVAN